MHTISQKNAEIAAYITSSLAACALCLCFIISGTPSYANAENTTHPPAIYTFAEDSENPVSTVDIVFDDSIWGRFARLLKKGLDSWQD